MKQHRGSSALVAALLATTALLFAAPAHADNDTTFIHWLYQHDMGCGQGSIRCDDPTDLIKMGKAACYDIDNNGDTVYQTVDKIMSIGQGDLNKNQSQALVAGAIGAYCPWDAPQ